MTGWIHQIFRISLRREIIFYLAFFMTFTPIVFGQGYSSGTSNDNIGFASSKPGSKETAFPQSASAFPSNRTNTNPAIVNPAMTTSPNMNKTLVPGATDSMANFNQQENANLSGNFNTSQNFIPQNNINSAFNLKSAGTTSPSPNGDFGTQNSSVSSATYGSSLTDNAVTGMQNQIRSAEYDPKVSTTKIYHEGAETLGRVGSESILKRDIIHQLRKFAQLHWVQEVKKMSPEEREKNGEILRQEMIKGYLTNAKSYSDALDGYIRKLLYYNDFVVSRPKEQTDEQKKKLAEVFEKEYLPALCKQFDCKNTKELGEYFKTQINSTLAEEKRLFIQETIGTSWLEYNLGTDTSEPTIVELRRYYETHLDQYKQEERVRWLSMSVQFSNHSSEQEAYDKIARMGNYVLEGETIGQQNQRFQEIAKKESEDFFASKGGQHDWTKRGVINSKVIEETVFSEGLPVGKLSRIIRDSNCFTIICVVQREGNTWHPFVDVQAKVKKKFIEEKRKFLQNKYENALSKRFTIELYNIGDTERRKRVENFFKETKSASGRTGNENLLR